MIGQFRRYWSYIAMDKLSCELVTGDGELGGALEVRR